MTVSDGVGGAGSAAGALAAGALRDVVGLVGVVVRGLFFLEVVRLGAVGTGTAADGVRGVVVGTRRVGAGDFGVSGSLVTVIWPSLPGPFPLLPFPLLLPGPLPELFPGLSPLLPLLLPGPFPLLPGKPGKPGTPIPPSSSSAVMLIPGSSASSSVG